MTGTGWVGRRAARCVSLNTAGLLSLTRLNWTRGLGHVGQGCRDAMARLATLARHRYLRVNLRIRGGRQRPTGIHRATQQTQRSLRIERPDQIGPAVRGDRSVAANGAL